MTPPKHDPTDEHHLDLAAADRLLLDYKRGKVGREMLRLRLIAECGYPAHLIDVLIHRVEGASLEQVERECGMQIIIDPDDAVGKR